MSPPFANQTVAAKLIKSADFFNTVLDNAAALVVVLDKDARIRQFNRACEQLTQYTFAEVEGKFVWDYFILPEDVERVKTNAFDPLVNEPERLMGQYTNYWRTRSGDRRLIEWSNSALLNDDGKMEFVIAVGIDVTEKYAAFEALERSEETYARAEAIAHIGSWDWNILTNDLHWTDEIYRIFGRTPQSFAATYPAFLDAIYPDDQQKVIVAVNASVADENVPYSIEHRVVRPDGEIRTVHERGKVYRDNNGKAVRMIGTVHDITERKQLDEELQQHREHLEDLVRERTRELELAKDQAERANRAKSEFLSRMSHELRTPMNAILGFSQVLEQENLSQEHLSYVYEIHQAGDHLLELINELLDLARIEAGRLVVAIETVALHPVIANSMQWVASLPQAKNVRISNECEQGARLLADPTRLKQILVNLLSNAVKYNRDGGSVRIFCERVGDKRLRLNVADTGAGIADDALARLFMPFERLGEEKSGIDGAGIGLALSKRLAELMGGAIGVSSTRGQGSTFWLELPMAEGETTSATQNNQPLVPEFAGKRKVLCIEDNAANLKLVEAMLRNQPALTLLSASTGEHGLELARRYRPDLILLDIHLPGMDGYAVLKELRADAHTRDIAVIALSADAMPIDVERGLASGFHQYITKPVNVTELIDAIYSAMPEISK